MAYSKITLEFTAVPSIDDVFSFSETLLGIAFLETFKENRLGSFQCTLPVYDAINDVYIGNIVNGYRSALSLDYNSTGLFTITKILVPAGTGFIIVEANFSGAVFTGTSNAFVDVAIENEVTFAPFSIDSVTFTPKTGEESSRCNVNIDTNHLATKVTSSIPLSTPTEATSNMLLYSEDVTNAAWTKELVNLSSKKVIPTNVYGYHTISQTVDKGSAAGNYTFSIYAKPDEYDIVTMYVLEEGGLGQATSGFNITTESFFGQFGFNGFTFISSSFEDIGDGYYRISIKVGLNSSNNIILKTGLHNNSGSTDFTGDNTSGLYLDKFQFQEGDLLPYIETINTALDVPYSDGLTINPNTENPIIFAAYRATTFNIEVEDENGLKVLQVVKTPAYLNIDNFTLSVTNSPDGGTLNISNVNSDGLELQYSLDNTTWQTSPVFSGLEVGNYTVYIKDQLGYSISKGFAVTEFGIYTPYFYISKSNSIRFANRITWGDSANYKTDENTLSHEAFAKDSTLAHTEIQQFQSANVITTQFKSNYETNTATIVKTDLSEVNVPVVKMSNNIGIKDKRDAFKYNLGNGKTGLYFQSGNIYDYVTGLSTGTHFLNGSLPEWASVGNYFKIDTSWLLIEEIFYDEAKSADVLVFSNIYTGADVAVIAASVFNRFNYEIYEFAIDMVDYIDQYFQVRINNTDDNFTEIIHLSEIIWCKVKHDKVLEIRYSNSSNTDLFYATGIENMIYIPYTYFKGKSDEDSEVHKTDTNSILLNADVYEVDEIVFEPVTKEIWRKLILALSHENVTINGVGYVKNGNFNSEGPLEDSNLYVLTASMIKTGSVYSSKSSGSADFDGTAVEVPGLIETDNGFVSY